MSTRSHSAYALSLAMLASGSLQAVTATGPQTPHDDSLAHLLQQVASSRPAAADPDFDCAWRRFALQYAPHTLPTLSAVQHQQLYDALELATLCNATYDDEAFELFVPGSHEGYRHRSRDHEAAAGVTIYADAEHGSDKTGDGSLQKPFASLPAAVAASRKSAAASASLQPQPRTVALRAGTYRLAETLILTEEDSGLTIASYPNEEAVISGNAVLSGCCIHVLLTGPSSLVWPRKRPLRCLYVMVNEYAPVKICAQRSWLKLTTQLDCVQARQCRRCRRVGNVRRHK